MHATFQVCVIKAHLSVGFLEKYDPPGTVCRRPRINRPIVVHDWDAIVDGYDRRLSLVIKLNSKNALLWILFKDKKLLDSLGHCCESCCGTQEPAISEFSLADCVERYTAVAPKAYILSILDQLRWPFPFFDGLVGLHRFSATWPQMVAPEEGIGTWNKIRILVQRSTSKYCSPIIRPLIQPIDIRITR